MGRNHVPKIVSFMLKICDNYPQESIESMLCKSLLYSQ